MKAPRKFILTHRPCEGRGHKLRDGSVEQCSEKTHGGGMIHVRPLDASWRQQIARSRVRELIGIDLKPGYAAVVSIKSVKVIRWIA